MSEANTLHDKLEICYSHCECANTNVAATFDLILDTAVRNGLTQAELPANVLILSDMEFDGCCDFSGERECGELECGDYKAQIVASAIRCVRARGRMRGDNRAQLFAGIARKFEQAGYKLPRLVFWNINSRTGTIPLKENELGVALVSGFSPAIAKMVLSETLDPYRCLLEQLDSPRYAPVEMALSKSAA